MSMTPREVVKRHLEFSGPDRIGIEFGRAKNQQSEFIWGTRIMDSKFTPKRWVEGNFEYYDDVWGNIWYRIKDMGAGGEIFKPALESWDQLKDFKMPDFIGSLDYAKAKSDFEGDKLNRFRVASFPGFPFAICRYLRKMEIYFQDLILERENVDRLHDMITTEMEKVIIKIGEETGADAIGFAEDWGIQDRLLIHPDMWREIFKPLYARLCKAARSKNLKVIMHSCGYNWEILGDLAEVGINAFNFEQPRVYGLERLADRLQELKIALYSPVDIQRVYPSGDKKLIQDEADNMVKLFFRGKGGFIATTYGDLKGIGVKEEWEEWAYQAFKKYA